MSGLLKDAAAVARLVHGFMYDFYRYARYAKVCSVKTATQRSYLASKLYHSLEKSLAFRDRSAKSGWNAAKQLVSLLEDSAFSSQPLSTQERVSIDVLKSFVDCAQEDHPHKQDVNDFLSRIQHGDGPVSGGAENTTSVELKKGMLTDPELFFMTRRSVRDFSTQSVGEDLIRRAVKLAITSPSVCNRQAWHVYHLESRGPIDEALTYQNGNRGFGHEIPCLLIVAADLEAFTTGYERYQPWIDGGIFTMALVLAIHSLGLSSCCLNWSQGPKRDKAFRKAFPVAGKHSIITMLAVGHPPELLKVCVSPRRPIDEFYTKLDRK